MAKSTLNLVCPVTGKRAKPIPLDEDAPEGEFVVVDPDDAAPRLPVGWGRLTIDIVVVNPAVAEVETARAAERANRDKVGTEPIDPLNDGGFAWLWDGPRLLPKINCFEKIILAVDSDGPGVNLMNDLAMRLGKVRCKWVRYPQGCKDLNDALMKYGERGVVNFDFDAYWNCGKVHAVVSMELELAQHVVVRDDGRGADGGVARLHKPYRGRTAVG